MSVDDLPVSVEGLPVSVEDLSVSATDLRVSKGSNSSWDSLPSDSPPSDSSPSAVLEATDGVGRRASVCGRCVSGDGQCGGGGIR